MYIEIKEKLLFIAKKNAKGIEGVKWYFKHEVN